MPTLHSPHPLQSPQCSYVPAHMATTVSPGNHYKVRMPTMQAASNAALAGGSSSTKQGHPIAKAPAMRYNGILVRAQANAISL